MQCVSIMVIIIIKSFEDCSRFNQDYSLARLWIIIGLISLTWSFLTRLILIVEYWCCKTSSISYLARFALIRRIKSLFPSSFMVIMALLLPVLLQPSLNSSNWYLFENRYVIWPSSCISPTKHITTHNQLFLSHPSKKLTSFCSIRIFLAFLIIRDSRQSICSRKNESRNDGVCRCGNWSQITKLDYCCFSSWAELTLVPDTACS